MQMEIVFPGGKKVDAIYNGFRVKTDQPQSYGGENSAPWPFSLFLASIGTCAGFMVLSFCQQRRILTDNLKLILKTERDKKEKRLSKIIIEIQLPSNFPEKYREAVIRAADLCPVKKYILNPPAFEIYTKIMPPNSQS